MSVLQIKNKIRLLVCLYVIDRKTSNYNAHISSQLVKLIYYKAPTTNPENNDDLAHIVTDTNDEIAEDIISQSDNNPPVVNLQPNFDHGSEIDHDYHEYNYHAIEKLGNPALLQDAIDAHDDLDMNEEAMEVDDGDELHLAIEKLGNPALFQDDFVMPSEILDDMNFPNNVLMDHDYYAPNAGNLSNDDDQDPVSIRIPDEVSDEVVQGFLMEHDYVRVPDDQTPPPNAGNQVDQAPLPNADNQVPLDNAGEGPSGYDSMSTASKWRARKRFVSETHPDLMAEGYGDTLGRSGKKVVLMLQKDPSLAKTFLRALDDKLEESEEVTPNQMIAHTHANGIRFNYTHGVCSHFFKIHSSTIQLFYRQLVASEFVLILKMI